MQRTTHHRRFLLPGLALAVVTMLGTLPSVASPLAEQASRASSPLARTYEAHGGLKKFQAKAQMQYLMRGFPLSAPMAKPNTSTVDLKTRRNRIDGDGFTVGWDGTRAWSVPGPDAVGLPPRFVTLGSFYFIGMPFVFADDGVILEDAGTASFRGKYYRVVKVRYESGIGHTDEDSYEVFIDPETDRVALINHSVTEMAEIERVTWTFDKWQEVEGLLIPAQMSFYAGWNPEDPGEGAPFTIENVRFSKRAPDSALYQAPANAVIADGSDAN